MWTEAGTTEDIGFVATDLAKALEHRDAATAVRGLDSDQKGTHQVRTPGGTQSLTVVSPCVTTAATSTELWRSRQDWARQAGTAPDGPR